MTGSKPLILYSAHKTLTATARNQLAAKALAREEHVTWRFPRLMEGFNPLNWGSSLKRSSSGTSMPEAAKLVGDIAPLEKRPVYVVGPDSPAKGQITPYVLAQWLQTLTTLIKVSAVALPTTGAFWAAFDGELSNDKLLAGFVLGIPVAGKIYDLLANPTGRFIHSYLPESLRNEIDRLMSTADPNAPGNINLAAILTLGALGFMFFYGITPAEWGVDAQAIASGIGDGLGVMLGALAVSYQSLASLGFKGITNKVSMTLIAGTRAAVSAYQWTQAAAGTFDSKGEKGLNVGLNMVVAFIIAGLVLSTTLALLQAAVLHFDTPNSSSTLWAAIKAALLPLSEIPVVNTSSVEMPEEDIEAEPVRTSLDPNLQAATRLAGVLPPRPVHHATLGYGTTA